MCLCMLEVSLFYWWCQRTVGRRSAGGSFLITWSGVIVYMCLCMLEVSLFYWWSSPGLVSLCTGVIVYMCLCMLEVSLFYCWCQRTVGRRSAGGFFFSHLVWCPCVLGSLCTCVFVCLRSLCFTVRVNGRSIGRSAGGFFFNHLVWCLCVLVSLCKCVFVCLRSLCFTDGFNALNVYTPQPHTRNNVAIEIASQTAHAVNSRRLGNSGHSGCRRRETRQMFKLYNLQYLYNRRLMYRKSQNSQGTMHKAAAKILWTDIYVI